MNYTSLGKVEAQDIIMRYSIDDGINSMPFSSKLTADERELRSKFQQRYSMKFPNTASPNFNEIKSNDDQELALLLYFEWLTLDDVVTNREVADDGFWRNLTCRIIPSYTRCRWEIKDKKWNHDRYFKKPQRNALKVLWWFIHLAYQGNKEKTFEVIKNCGSDQISQIVDRAGDGYDVEFTRAIFRQIGRLKNQKDISNALRAAMKMNTLRRQTTAAAFYSSGYDAYAATLFKSLD